MPETPLQRLLFAVDLSTSLRGLSWVRGRRFNWCPYSVSSRQAVGLSRATFFKQTAILLVISLLIMDIVSTIDQSRVWRTDIMYPVTTQPLHVQLLASLALGLNTLGLMDITQILGSSVAVALGSAPESWVPMFNAPFLAEGLADFWSWRWHSLFRRSFDRLSIPILALVPTTFRKLARPFAAFALSALIHMTLMYHLETNKQFVHPRLLDHGIMLCFASQPLGIIIERFIITPVSRSFLPKRLQTVLTRIFAAVWLIWFGRYFADTWARRGLWAPNQYQKMPALSVVRGVWQGRWLV
jgi:hypothetical protein